MTRKVDYLHKVCQECFSFSEEGFNPSAFDQMNEWMNWMKQLRDAVNLPKFVITVLFA